MLSIGDDVCHLYVVPTSSQRVIREQLSSHLNVFAFFPPGCNGCTLRDPIAVTGKHHHLIISRQQFRRPPCYFRCAKGPSAGDDVFHLYVAPTSSQRDDVCHLYVVPTSSQRVIREQL